jgi:hypothetical protein
LFEDKVTQNNSKILFNLITQQSKPKLQIPSKIVFGYDITEADREIANLFNSYFSSVFLASDCGPASVVNLLGIDPSRYCVNKEEVSFAIKQIKYNTSTGLDGVPACIYKNFCYLFSHYLWRTLTYCIIM